MSIVKREENSMRLTEIKVVMVFAVICLFVTPCSAGRPGGTRSSADGVIAKRKLHDAVKIILIARKWDDAKGKAVEKKVTIENEKTVKQFIDAIKLTPRPLCFCRPTERVVFVKKRGQEVVHITSHCFDLSSGVFVMPKAFYELFQKHLYGNKEKPEK